MKRILVALIACVLCFATVDTQAQTKKGSRTTKTAKGKSKSKKGKNNKKTTEEKPVDTGVSIPYNANDCLFAIELQPDVAFGPTKSPSGGGRVMEIMSDKNHPYLFDYEHNTVWYKFRIPYNGELELEITPVNPSDDYDFLLYRYTNQYFSNHIIQNRIMPVAVNMSSIDTSAVSTVTTTVKGKQVTRKSAVAPSVGMKHTATAKMLTKDSTSGYLKSIPVHKDDVYYLVLDNVNGTGGHTVKFSIHAETFDPMVMFYDPSSKKNTEVELLVIEKGATNREVLKDPAFKSGRLKFLPNTNYTLYAKKPGYFSVYKDFNSNMFMTDTLMRFVMNRAEKGSTFAISDIYFEDGETNLMKESDSVLINYIAMFRNHPEVTFMVKGYVTTYGVDVQRDQQISLGRAQSVKEFFVNNGIDASRIEVSGMTPAEIKRAGNAMFDKKGNAEDVKVELIITGNGTQQKGKR